METCIPVGTLAPIVLAAASCACGATLHAVPAGDEWTYVDDQGRGRVDTRPKSLREDPRGWWEWLATENIGTYSRLSAAINLGCFSWTHVHHDVPNPGVGDPYDVPECHEMPMQYVPDGWRCRVQGAVFPVSVLQVA